VKKLEETTSNLVDTGRKIGF